MQIRAFARFAQIYAVRVSEFVRKTIGRFYGSCFGEPSQRARGTPKSIFYCRMANDAPIISSRFFCTL
jgi:hypothetical protein